MEIHKNTLDNWIAANKERFGSQYEVLFAKNVLPLIVGLELNNVSIQYPFQDSQGKKRYCDFVIVESEFVRLAIEIDGYDKRGQGAGMSHEDFIDWQRRQASLVSQGWYVLRFANKDVRDYPHQCAEHINKLMKKLRLNEEKKIEIVSIEDDRLENVLNGQEELKRELAKTRAATKRSWILFSFALTAILIGALIYKANDTLEVAVKPHQQSFAAASNIKKTYGELVCSEPLPFNEAKNNVGQVSSFVGKYVSSYTRENSAGPIWLNIGEDFPSSNRLSIVIWGEYIKNFNLLNLQDSSWNKVSGRESDAVLCVMGKVEMYRGVPQIAINSPAQILFVEN